MPKIEISKVKTFDGTDYPAPYDAVANGRLRQAIGDAGGLDQFGVNLTRLLPGAASAHRHWHAREDEFIFILDGEATLIEDDGETILRKGEAAAFKAGTEIGHHLVNRSNDTVTYLEVGTRQTEDVATYTDPDVDMKFIKTDGKWVVHRKNGRPF